MTDEKALQSPIVYVISDSIGETAEFVVRAAASQFNGGDVKFAVSLTSTVKKLLTKLYRQLKRTER